MRRARERLEQLFPNAVFTSPITTAAYGKSDTANPYANMLLEGYTDMPETELTLRLKRLEKELGDTTELRGHDIIMMDIDLLLYNEERRHHNDWERPYTKTLLQMLAKVTMIVTILFTVCTPVKAVSNRVSTPMSAELTKQEATELLGKGVEYYQSGKYHECILTFEKLRKHYKLTPRFLAYLGFCYYKEQQYKAAVESLESSIPELGAFAPKEQAAYIYACAESLFFLGRYKEALAYYDKALPLTYGNDKGDVLFHTAFSIYLDTTTSESGNTSGSSVQLQKVHSLLTEARSLYKANTSTATSLQRARLRQCETMLKGLSKKIYGDFPPDSIPKQPSAR